MLKTPKLTMCTLASLLLCGVAYGIANQSANPYQGIVDRNVFGLKPVPIAEPVQTQKVTDLPPITLTGLTTILNTKRALLNVQAPGKPVQSYIIAEGQRDGDIEVLEIDEKTGSVKVNQAGTIVPLNFEKNGPKLTAAASPPPAGIPGTPGVPTPISYATPGTVNPAAGGLRTIPTRNPPTQVNQSAAANNANGNFNGNGNLNPGFAGGISSTPSLGFNPVVAPGNTQIAAPPPVDPDTQAMQMLAQHVQNKDQGLEMPPLPPPLAEALGEPNTGVPQIPQPGSTGSRGYQGPPLPRAPGLPPPLPQ